MIPIISSIQVAQRRFSFYIAVNAASVLAPGVVIIIEAILMFEHSRLSSPQLASLFHLKHYSSAAVVLITLVIAAAGYVFGYVARELAFKFLQQVERIPHFRQRLQEDVQARLQDYFSNALINECFDAHRILSRFHSVSIESARATDRAGGGHRETIDYRAFTYAKLWIRNYAPGLSIDSIEAEINILVSGLIPTLLAAADVIVLNGAKLLAIILAGGFLALAWSVLLDSIERLRCTERWEGLRNLVMDYAMREAAAKYPLGQELQDSQGE
jgi:hypothetical protein